MEDIQAMFEVPGTGHFCSLYKEAFDLPDFVLEELEEGLASDTNEGRELLVELLCRLLNGCYGRHDIGPENYNFYLNDIFSFRLEQEQEEVNPLKDATFFQLPVRQKVTVLYHLCHFRLDADDVAGRLKGLRGDSMRVEPLGTDASGAKYWYFYGTRLYKEAPRPLLEETTKKKSKGRKKKKRGRKGKSRQLEEEESSENEALSHLMAKPEDDDDELPKTPAVKKAARLHVNLEKKEDDDDAGEDEIDLDLQDNVESLKFSSDEEEENFFEDHSSDEDYSEKGSKKQKNGKKKKTIGSKTSKTVKTPAAKRSKVPEVMRVTPRSARLRAKFGYGREDSRASNDDRQSSSSRSTSKSDKRKSNGRKRRKKASTVDDTSEKMQSRSVKNGSDQPGNKKAAGKKSRKNGETKHAEDETSQSCEEDMAVDVTTEEKDMDGDAGSEKTEKLLSDELNEESKMDAESAPEHSHSSDQTAGKNVQKDASQPDSDLVVVDDADDNITPDLDDNNSQKDVKGEPSSRKVSVKQEPQTTNQDTTTTPSDQATSDDSRPHGDAKMIKEEDCDDKKPAVKVENIDQQQSSRKPVTLSIRLYAQPKLEDTDSQESKLSSNSGGRWREREAQPWRPREDTLAGQKSGWHLVCEVTEDWQHLVASLEDSANCGQRALVKILREDFLPEIPAIQEEKEKEERRRRLEMAPRRLSTRLLYKKKEQADRERILTEAQEEEDQLRAEEEEERKRRMEERKQEALRRQREEKERAREERAKRVKLREKRAKLISEGKEIPPELLNGVKNDGPAPEEQTLDDEVVAKLHKVLAVCFKDEESWPFVHSVEEKIAPGYFEVIKMPMNLTEMEEKLKNGRYRSREELGVDMDLIVDNCESYNGEDNDFSIMARNLRKGFQQAMRRFFPVGRQKKDDEDFVVEGKVIPPAGRRYKAQRAASKKALDSFHDILNDVDDFLPHESDVEASRPKGSGSLRKQAGSFQGYEPRKKILVLGSSPQASSSSMVGPSMQAAASPSQPTQVVYRTGSNLIEVHTFPPTARPAQPGPSAVSVSQRAAVSGEGGRVGGVPPGSVVAYLNRTAKDGTTERIRCLLPADKLSLLKPQSEAGQGGRPMYVSITRAQTSGTEVTTTLTLGRSNLTQVLAPMHQSGALVKTALVPAGQSLLSTTLQPSVTVVSGSSASAGISSPMVVAGGRSLLGAAGVSGNKPIILGGSSLQSVVGSSSLGNAQVVMVPGKSQVAQVAGTLPTTQAGSSATANTPTAGPSKPVSQVVQMSKEMYHRLVAENKARMVVGPGGRAVLQLMPGVQLVPRAPTPSLPAAATTVPQGSAAMTSTVPTPTLTVGVPQTCVTTASSGLAPRIISVGGAGRPQTVLLPAAVSSTMEKKPVVVDPWSVNERVPTSSALPLTVGSLSLGQSASQPSLSFATATTPVVQPTMSVSSFAPVVISPRNTTVASGLGVITLSPAQLATPSGLQLATTSGLQLGTTSGLQLATSSGLQLGTSSGLQLATSSGLQLATSSGLQLATSSGLQLGTPSGIQLGTPSGLQTVHTLSSIIPGLASSGLTVSPTGQVLVSAGSLISPSIQGGSVTCSLNNTQGVTSPSQLLHTGVPQASPVGAPKVIVLPSNPVWPAAQRSLFTSVQEDSVSEDSSDTSSLVGFVPQAVSSASPSIVSRVCAPLTVTGPGFVSSAQSASAAVHQPPLVSIQTPGVLSSQTVSGGACMGSGMGSSVQRTSGVVPSFQTVCQPVQGSVLSVTPAAAELSQGLSYTSAQRNTVATTSVTLHRAPVCSSSSMQGTSYLSSIPKTVACVAQKFSSAASSTRATQPRVESEPSPSSPSKSAPHPSGRGRPQSCKRSLPDSGDQEAQTLVKDGDHEAGQGRSRRSVVNRDYKAFAGFSSKSGNRRSSGSRPPSQSGEMDCAESPSPKASPRKRSAACDGDHQASKVICLSPSSPLEAPIQGGVGASAAVPRVICLSPSTMLDESPSKDRVQAQQSPAVSVCGSQPLIRAALAEQSQEQSCLIPLQSSSTLTHTQHVHLRSPQISHSSKENVNSVVDIHASESDEEMEVDGICTSSQPNSLNQPPHSGGHSDNLFESFSSSAIQVREVGSPRLQGNTEVSRKQPVSPQKSQSQRLPQSSAKFQQHS